MIDIEDIVISAPAESPKAFQGIAPSRALPYPAFSSRPTVYSLLKRSFDVVFSLILCVLFLSWLVPLLALLIKAESAGPVFFIQKRTGFRNRSFWCFKFRTMRNNDAADSLQASGNDSRITRVGRFLRNTNLDELPQLFNVLKGEMSIVGPRPHMISHTKEFSLLVEGYGFRHEVKPGLTGLAQIKGWRGPTPTFRSIYKRVQWDVYYVNHQSARLDAYILLLTIREVINNFY
jgi:putative colanic acid biosynthesis UDP-glucose lipid carrier transferase